MDSHTFDMLQAVCCAHERGLQYSVAYVARQTIHKFADHFQTCDYNAYVHNVYS